jgi:long-subunit fatty acid transport protein
MRQILGLLMLISAFTVEAQVNGEEKLGSWHMYFGTNRISNNLSIHTEAQLRYYEQAENFNQLLLRTGINYHFDPNAWATFGYGYIVTDGSFEEFPDETNSIEHRIFERFFLKNKVWEFNFEHRYTLEQRFLDFGDSNDVQHRMRYRLQMTLPLTNTFFLNFYDEIFINLQDDIFDQNRLYAALGVNVTENLSVQAGYLKNHFTGAHFDRLQIGVTYNPDLRGLLKKK